MCCKYSLKNRLMITPCFKHVPQEFGLVDRQSLKIENLSGENSSSIMFYSFGN